MKALRLPPVHILYTTPLDDFSVKVGQNASLWIGARNDRDTDFTGDELE